MNAVSFVLIPCVSHIQLGRRRSLAAILAMCASSQQRAAHALLTLSQARTAGLHILVQWPSNLPDLFSFPCRSIVAIVWRELLPLNKTRFAIVQ